MESQMARYKHIDTSPRFIPVDLERQLVPGTFAYALSYLIDHQLDFSVFDQRYRNDARGATAGCCTSILWALLSTLSKNFPMPGIRR
jgi:hypothetical protein